MTGSVARRAAALLACVNAPAIAAAQTQPTGTRINYISPYAPEPGDVHLYLYNLDPAPNPVASARFNAPDASLEMEHVSPDALVQRYPSTAPSVSQIGRFGADVNVAGVLIYVNYDGPNRGTRVAVPCLSVVDASQNSDPTDSPRAFLDTYGAVFAGADYQAGYDAYRAFLRGDDSAIAYQGTRQFSASDFRSDVYSCSVERNTQNPIVGSPASLQYEQVADGLDFTGPAEDADDPAWGLGGRIGKVQRGGRYGVQLDARLNRTFRVIEGSRALLSLEVPVGYQEINGQRQWRGYAAVALSYPVKPWLTITPRLAYGYTSAPEQEIKGQVASGTVAGTVFFPGLVGRGTLTGGLMLGYSKVTHVEFAGETVDGNTSNVTFRGGGAYELPLGRRLFGRAASARGSYSFTVLTGDNVFVNKVHEFAASVGVRSRGDESRNGFELLRVGILARQARRSDAAFLFAGYRF